MAGIVKISQGEVEGVNLKSFKGKEYVGFLGIPYAEAQTGEKQFKHPEPHKGWEGVFKANKTVDVLQIDLYMKNITVNKDGLAVNVFVNKDDLETHEQKTPVMVFIHGG